MNIASFLAQIGLVSRSRFPQVLKQNLLYINGQITKHLCDMSDGDQICYDGQSLVYRDRYTILLHKPCGYVCSDRDERGLPSYQQLLGDYPYRKLVSCAGRLDANSRGLVLCTSDGNLIHRLTHPKSKLPKTYLVQTKFPLSDGDLCMLAQGIVLDDGYQTLPCHVSRESSSSYDRVSLTIVEGKFHQIKRMMIAVHNQVEDLHRIAIGPYILGDLPSGKWKEIKMSISI